MSLRAIAFCKFRVEEGDRPCCHLRESGHTNLKSFAITQLRDSQSYWLMMTQLQETQSQSLIKPCGFRRLDPTHLRILLRTLHL